ncbi:MAG TPA: hypothetical protein VKB80_09385 [Kofleriaceae bacterium]|nr:hypothetical protein [Kofleriaceae bacterium]
MGSPRAAQHRLLLSVPGLVCAALTACGPSGGAPVLEPVEDRVVAVDQELVLVLAATDDDGDELRYSFTADVPDIEGRATIGATRLGAGEFRWIPLASDVGVWTFDFTVSDGSHRDTATARIDVRSAIGAATAPRFLHPQGMGTTLDLTRATCAGFGVEVVDSDSAEVAIGQLEPLLDGADLDQTDGLHADWRWCPSGPQIEADDRYSVVLSADDHDNPPTAHPYLIVLRRPTKPDCPGEAPVVAHEARDVDSGAGLTIAADISDDQGLKREPLLYVADSPPADPPDLSAMTQLTMRLTAGDMTAGTWSASLPNPVAGEPAGTSGQLYYLIAVTDDDDPEGSCDHLTQVPADGVFTMTVTSPGGEGGGALCEACDSDVQCGGADDLCVPVGGAGAFCLGACDGPDDCPAGYSCSGAPVASVDGASARQCVPLSSDCADPAGGTCEDDELEDNDSPAQAAALPLLAAGRHDLVSCPAALATGDDEDWFDIEVPEEGELTLALAGGAASDLDLALHGEDGALLAASQSFSSDESVSACVPAGIYTARVFAFGAGRNPYSLTVSQSPGSCAATCEADDNEDDDGPAQARVPAFFPDPFTSLDQSICSGDDDWYQVDLFTGERLLVDLAFDQAGSQEDLDIHLYDEAAVDLTPCSPEAPDGCALDNGQSADSDEHFEAAAPASCDPCTFYVVVRGFGDSENRYDISIGLDQ